MLCISFENLICWLVLYALSSWIVVFVIGFFYGDFCCSRCKYIKLSTPWSKILVNSLQGKFDWIVNIDSITIKLAARSFWITGLFNFYLIITILFSSYIFDINPSKLNLELKNLVPFFIPMILFPFGLYWRMDAIVGRKWLYLANQFNNIALAGCQKTGCETTNCNSDGCKSILWYNFYIDLISLEQWTNGTYKTLFSDKLKNLGCKDGYIPKSKAIEFLKNIH